MKTYKSYKVGRDGVILGTFEEPEMVYMINCGKIIGTDDFWTDGMSSWAKVSARESWTISSVNFPACDVGNSGATPPVIPVTSNQVLPVGGSNSSQSEWEIRRESLVDLEMNRRRQLRESTGVASDSKHNHKVDQVSFFTIWWKTVLVIYVAGACVGYLNSGEYGLGYALGGGLIVAPMSGLFFGGIIYALSKK
jgi:hypothetical protein